MTPISVSARSVRLDTRRSGDSTPSWGSSQKSQRAAVGRIFHNPPLPKEKGWPKCPSLPDKTPFSEARTSQGLSPRGTREQKGWK